MRFSLNKNGRSKSNLNSNPSSATEPAPPLPDSVDAPTSPRSFGLKRSSTVLERTRKQQGNPDRRSIAGLAEKDQEFYDAPQHFNAEAESSRDIGTDIEQEATRKRAPDYQGEYRPHTRGGDSIANQPSMSSEYDNSSVSGKVSSDSGQNFILDRWSQRRLQRLNTEQGFREQRQGVHGVLQSPSSQTEHPSTPVYGRNGQNNYAASSQYSHGDLTHQQPRSLHSSHQPSSGAYQAQRTGHATTQPNTAATGYAFHAPPTTKSDSPRSAAATVNSQDSPSYATAQQQSQQQYHSPQHQLQRSSENSPETASQPESSHLSSSARPSLQSNRHPSAQQTPQSIISTHTGAEEASMSASHNANSSTAKGTRVVANNRQSVLTGPSSREAPASGGGLSGGHAGMPAFNTAVVPQGAQSSSANGNATVNGQGGKGPPGQQGEMGRVTPLSAPTIEEMSEEEIAQLIKDHKELREKYTKVKKYYFEKEDQVKQLQNSLAHQRLSQSRTSLDDSEYTTRFSRLDGLIAQLAFSIRKSWKVIPPWLHGSVNKDAVLTGKQEMTAVGRAVISCWIVEECFKRYFHPDLEPNFSMELKRIQQNIRLSAPPPHSAEEEDFLTAKIVNWRLATLDGLQDSLRSSQCAIHRSQLTETLNKGLVRTLSAYLQDPAPSDLEGGVHMIVELIVSIAIHIPLESRDVVIEYFMPGQNIMPDQMKMESGIPALSLSLADDHAERVSNGSVTSDATDLTAETAELPKKKRSMLSALTGTGKGKPTTAPSSKHSGAAGSTTSLGRPDSTHGEKEPPRVRLAAGLGVQIRSRGILLKAPIFST